MHIMPVRGRPILLNDLSIDQSIDRSINQSINQSIHCRAYFRFLGIGTGTWKMYHIIPCSHDVNQ